jgi:hypothetical protein
MSSWHASGRPIIASRLSLLFGLGVGAVVIVIFHVTRLERVISD